MAYEKTTWVSGETPLSADNMNNIEDGIEELKSKYIYKSATNSSADGSSVTDIVKASFTRALSSISQDAPDVNQSYPVMIVISGEYSGTFTGTIAVTATAIRFLLFSEAAGYSGAFVRSSGSITSMMVFNGQSA